MEQLVNIEPGGVEEGAEEEEALAATTARGDAVEVAILAVREDRDATVRAL